MVLAIALVSVTVGLLLFFMLYLYFMVKVHGLHPTYVQSGPQRDTQDRIKESDVKTLGKAARKDARIGVDLEIETQERTYREKYDESKKYDINQTVLVSYAKACPINRPIPLIVSFVPTVPNADKLFQEVESRCRDLMPRGTKPDKTHDPLNFQALELDPKIKVELSFLDGTFKSDPKSIVKRLQQDKVTEFLFLVTPVVATELTILVRVKYMKKSPQMQSEEEIELLVKEIYIKSKALGNLDSRQLSLATWILGVGIVVAAAAVGAVMPDSRVAMIILGVIGFAAKPVIGTINLVDIGQFKKAAKD